LGFYPLTTHSLKFIAVLLSRVMVKSSRYRILALDVDGTLLDADGMIRPQTANAVARAAQAGIRPVLCTGRRYRRARPIARQLGLDAPIVCNSGAIIKDPIDHRTIWRADFDEQLARAVLQFFVRQQQPPVIFTDRHPDFADFLVPAFPTGRLYFDDYVAQNREFAEINPAICSSDFPLLSPPGANRGLESLFHVCAIGTRSQMLDFQAAAHECMGNRIQTFVQRSPRYLGTMCEILRHDASKWTAILHVAELWGVTPGEICAVGDDANDIPMLRHAGLGVAMGHASAEVRNAANFVIGSHDEDGLVRLVDDILIAG
jgi:Cof subfamily protein (haloacid dehalogenase superfamily)